MADLPVHGFELLTPSGSTRYRGRAGYWARLSYEEPGTAPTITLVSPAEYTALAPTDAVTIDVTDDGSLRHVELRATQLDDVEDVYNGVSFTPRYVGSTRSAVSGGYRYVVRRAAGWIAAPTFTVDAIDTEGNKTP